jgi:2'-5' RNA ligase
MSILGSFNKRVFALILGLCSVLPANSASKNYISYDLEYKPFEEMRLKLEKDQAVKLKNRGEAHITLVTPPEFEKLSQKLKPEEIHELAEKFLKTKPIYEKVCVGSGSLQIKSQAEKTFYVVIKSKELFKFRKKLAKLAKISKDQFDPNLFYPHVTLGFTERDLHFEDGVIKNEKSCLK